MPNITLCQTESYLAGFDMFSNFPFSLIVPVVVTRFIPALHNLTTYIPAVVFLTHSYQPSWLLVLHTVNDTNSDRRTVFSSCGWLNFVTVVSHYTGCDWLELF